MSKDRKPSHVPGRCLRSAVGVPPLGGLRSYRLKAGLQQAQLIGTHPSGGPQMPRFRMGIRLLAALLLLAGVPAARAEVTVQQILAYAPKQVVEVTTPASADA